MNNDLKALFRQWFAMKGYLCSNYPLNARHWRLDVLEREIQLEQDLDERLARMGCTQIDPGFLPSLPTIPPWRAQ